MGACRSALSSLPRVWSRIIWAVEFLTVCPMMSSHISSRKSATASIRSITAGSVVVLGMAIVKHSARPLSRGFLRMGRLAYFTETC